MIAYIGGSSVVYCQLSNTVHELHVLDIEAKYLLILKHESFYALCGYLFAHIAYSIDQHIGPKRIGADTGGMRGSIPPLLFQHC
jgi:uncharacterized protein YunC (DUF1805 family)